jgi:hypothetical protein
VPLSGEIRAVTFEARPLSGPGRPLAADLRHFGVRVGISLIETTTAIVIGDEPATRNGTGIVVTENGTVTLTIADGDSAAFFRSVIINARDSGVIKDNWVVSIVGGVTLSFKDPATLPLPYDLAFSQDQIDYPQRL